MNFRSTIISCIIGLLFLPFAFAQKDVVATVDPNKDIYNSAADLYEPSTGSFSPVAGDMLEPREDHTAVVLPDGRVLIAGGRNNRYLNSVEIYDPSTATFGPNTQTVTSPITGLATSTRGNLQVARAGASAILLLDDTVLIAGGFNGDYLGLSEIYSPQTGVFKYTTSALREARYHARLVLLEDGKVLVTGGVNTAFLSSAEIYNPFTGFFNLTASMTDARVDHTATLLNDGRVLITGGCSNTESDKIVCDNYLSSAEIYDPAEGTFESTGSLNHPRAGHTASLLPDGRVLIAGGTDAIGPLATAEIFDPDTGTFTSTGNMAVAKEGHTATVLADGKILMAGGYSGSYLNSAEIYNPSSGTFQTVNSTMSRGRLYHQATELHDGSVLLTGGENATPLVFDVNIRSTSDNVSPDMVFSPDSQTGFVPYTGSGVVVAFSAATGAIVGRIETGGYPAFVTPLPDGIHLAVVSVLDNRIFIISMATLTLEKTYTFAGAEFGFGSRLALSPDGTRGYISSTGTGEVIQFNIDTGSELGRLIGLETPAQLALTPDGGTLLVVETTTAEVYFVDAASMNTRYKMTPRDSYASAAFSIYNKPVLNPDGDSGVITGWDINSSTTNPFFVFDVSTGEITDSFLIGNMPAFTTLSPSQENWMVLSDGSVSIIPVDDFDSGKTIAIPGSPLRSSNMVFSEDGRFAFFSSSSTDKVLQLDLETESVVGAFDVGDFSADIQDQPANLALTPDGKVLSVINFISNEVDLLADATLLKIPEFINDTNKFTGISLINLSASPARLTLKAFNNSGTNTFQLSDGSFDAIEAIPLGTLPPNGQLAVDLSEVLDFDNTKANEGHLEIVSDQTSVVGFAVTGTIGSRFLNTYLTGMSGVKVYRFPDRLYDWISPDISFEELQGNVPDTEFVFTNPNYNGTDYEVIQYGSDGSQLQGNTGGSLSGSQREILSRSELFSSSPVSSVLITGGKNVSARRSTELYLTDSALFTNAGTMMAARFGHAASLLPSGQVLVTGGRSGANVLSSAEIYSPIYKTFAAIVGTMIEHRYRHTSTALYDGSVLVAGGQNAVSINATAEIFDPETRTFHSTAGAMHSARDAHTATLLPDGRVLLAGGIDGFGLSSSAELYDPLTSTFSLTGSMAVGRAFHTSVLLADGRVLITGGYNGTYLSSAEIYDPQTGMFAALPPMNVARSEHTATLLQDGTVLIAGGRNESGTLDSVEFYFPSTNTFALMPRTLATPRSQHTATLFEDGRVLLVGGSNEDGVVPDSEIYNPESQVFSTESASQGAQAQHTATLLRGLIAGYMRGSSPQGLIFRQNLGAAARRIGTEAVDVDRFAGVTNIYSPYFITAFPGRTVLNLINANEDEDAVVTVTLHDFGGSVIGSPVTFQLPIGHQVNKDLTNLFLDYPEIQDHEGWIEINSTVDRVAGTVSFGIMGGNILSSFELSALPLDRFILPLSSEDNDYRTEMMLLNTTAQSATVRIELWGESGSLDNSIQLNLAPNASLDGFLSDYFQADLNRLYGYVRVISSQPLHAYATLWGVQQEFACGMPPIPIPEE